MMDFMDNAAMPRTNSTINGSRRLFAA